MIKKRSDLKTHEQKNTAMQIIHKNAPLRLKATLVLGLCCGLYIPTALADATATATVPVALPNPLTLEFALEQTATAALPLQLQAAKLAYAQAQVKQQSVSTNVVVDAQGRLGRREFAEENQAHNLLALHVGKVLYDFNQNQYAIDAAQQNALAEQTRLGAVENQYRLSLMQAFFNVLLADFQYRIDNEEMAVAFIGFDKAKDYHALGKLSDVDLLSEQTAYEKILVKRSQSATAQLQSRLQLANALNLPTARPDELSFPDLKSYVNRDVKGLNLQTLQEQALQNNLPLQALTQQLAAQQLALQSSQSLGKPTVRGDAWAGQLSSYPETREGAWQVGITVDVPLYDGGARSAAVALSSAQMHQAQANIQLYSQQLRDDVADVYFKIQLLAAEKTQNNVFGDYADLYLDYSRALYENESSTDLGDAMVRLSQANFNDVAWQFKQALLWAQLDYLLGKSVTLEAASESVVSMNPQK
jgi:outer membrane protein TolC